MQKKWPFLILIIVMSFSCAFGQGRLHRNFDNDWKFQLGHASNAAKDFNYTIANIFSKSGKAEQTAIDAKFNDSGWRNLDLPHDWAVELPFVESKNFDVVSHGFKPVGGLYPETSIGWYRKHFTVPQKDSGQRFQIQFDGIFRDANIWLNGFYLGNNKSGYVGVSYDITDYINFDKENVLVVRADASQSEGWFYEGAGIYRHVWLNQYHNLHIATDGIFAYSSVDKNRATITVETTVQNQAFATLTGTLSTYLTDREGRKKGAALDQSITLSGNENKVLKQTISIASPKLWSVDNPYLYRIVSVIKISGRQLDSVRQRFGIRTIKIDATNGLFLNGENIKIKGTNNHQDHAGVGSALPDYLQYYRIWLLKQMGSNAYRASHHAPTIELLDACDSLGMLVMDEQRLLNSSPEYLDQFERLIKRDRSRACVFMWSIGNEEGYLQTNSTGKRMAQTFIAKQQQLDPTRTCTYAADLGNVYRGINEVIPVRSFNYRQKAVADYHRDHPHQPIIGTEMGSTVTTRGIYFKDTIRAYVPDQDITAPWWASKAEEWWPLAAENKYWAGGFIWTGFDYRGEPTPYEWPNVNSHFGVMDVCGFPKNIYYYYQSWWTDNDVLHISPHWNWKGREGQPIDVWVNSNADNVDLFLNGKSLGKKVMPRNSHLQWSVPYQAGTLEAVAYKNGKKITSKVATTSDPVEVVITPYKTTMIADGKDATVINVNVIDKEGRAVPDADNLVTFSISGGGKIIGMGNGDPSSHEADRPIQFSPSSGIFVNDTICKRKLFNGKCQVIVQSGKQQGQIYFEAKSEGLWSGSTTIMTIDPIQSDWVSAQNKYTPVKIKDRMVGADISFLPELEDKGMKFFDNGKQKDAIEILHDHGINYIRLRIFNNPAADSGYSPGKGYCDLTHTLQMAKRIKAAGMKFLLDFHYSDYWADPQQQYKPLAWKELNYSQLRDAVKQYTKQVMLSLQAQGTLPDMVQVGNEINHGMIWPDGEINNLTALAQLVDEGIAGVKEISPDCPVMLHVALGGQHDETVFFLNNMLSRGIQFDVIGLSYYPKWHGTLEDLSDNMNDLAKRYKQYIVLVEYSQLKKEVNDITFNIVDDKGTGTFIWEPLSTWEQVFDKDGKSNELIKLYDEISKRYIFGKK